MDKDDSLKQRKRASRKSDEPNHALERIEDSRAVKLAGLGSVDFWLNHPGVIGYTAPSEGSITLTAGQVKTAVRDGLADARQLLPDRTADPRDVARDCIGKRLESAASLAFHRVVNATGVILHTNLGRAPIHPEIVRMATETVSGYTNLEISIADGKRSKRVAGLEAMLEELADVESALVVNNCAAALHLILSALAGNPFADGMFINRPDSDWHAHPNEVVISRGELVQIGGGFRVPLILEASGAVLKEVGTTNVTFPEDYERAITPATAMILKASTSNFIIEGGFTESVAPPQLAEIAHKAGIPFVCDIGSATLADERLLPAFSRISPAPFLRAGADIVCFSGDKLLGGPQAGIILGRKDAIEKLRKHPIMRTLRLDKWTAALLSSLLWAMGNDKLEYLPVIEMMNRDASADKKTAARMKRAIERITADKKSHVTVDIIKHYASIGGGSLPGQNVESYALAVALPDTPPDELASKLRKSNPPIFGIIQDNRFLLNVRTLLRGDDKSVVGAVAGV